MSENDSVSPLFDKMDALLARHRGEPVRDDDIPVLTTEAVVPADADDDIPVLTDEAVVPEPVLMFDPEEFYTPPPAPPEPAVVATPEPAPASPAPANSSTCRCSTSTRWSRRTRKRSTRTGCHHCPRPPLQTRSPRPSTSAGTATAQNRCTSKPPRW
ncbi:hypothetical protein [Jeongeupia sp. USM3]|uniref:hypothetical protein n=1 Tax=Jeongeupia sp. USM3 TaxID=1906741 RepID=UPI00089DFC1C|nr:hypothetical protein [Jeongeupia sp. USM3]AOY00520.1 hypothetical protein BJP62_08750 [Jeongeupia sp. USM3]